MHTLAERVKEHLKLLTIAQIEEVSGTEAQITVPPMLTIGGGFLQYNSPCVRGDERYREVRWEELSGKVTQNQSIRLSGLCEPLSAFELFQDIKAKLKTTTISVPLRQKMHVIGLRNKKNNSLDWWFPCSLQFARLVSYLGRCGEINENDLAKRLVFGREPDQFWAIARWVLFHNEAVFLEQEQHENARKPLPVHPAFGNHYPLIAGPDPPKACVDWRGMRLGMQPYTFLQTLNDILRSLGHNSCPYDETVEMAD